MYPWTLDRFSLSRSSLDNVPCLHGSMRYGDCEEDEWMVAFLLFQITQRFKRFVATLQDQDGEFLLIEAADVLPEWLEPSCSANRIFIRDGALLIIPPQILLKPSLKDALDVLRGDMSDSNVKADIAIQNIVQERIAPFDCKDFESPYAFLTYRAAAIVPAKLAYCLEKDPSLLGLITDKFYLRSPEEIPKAILFPNLLKRDQTQWVRKFLKFSRIQYAKLVCQHLEPPRTYFQGAHGVFPNELSNRINLGAKLAVGFELLLLSHPEKTAVMQSFSEKHHPLSDTDRPDDSLDWMIVKDEVDEKNLKSSVLTEAETTSLMDRWDREFEEGEDEPDVANLDASFERLRSFITREKSAFDGVAKNDAEEEHSASESESESESFDSEDDETNDEGFLEEEILQVLAYDPDLLMRIVQLNSEHGLDSAELLERIKKMPKTSPASSAQPQKGLRDIDPAKLEAARQSRRPKVEPEAHHSEDDLDKSLTDHSSSSNEEYYDDFACGTNPSFAQFKASLDKDEPSFSDIMDQMDRELQSKLRTDGDFIGSDGRRAKLPAHLDEQDLKANLVKNLKEAGNDGNPATTILLSSRRQNDQHESQ